VVSALAEVAGMMLEIANATKKGQIQNLQQTFHEKKSGLGAIEQIK
jgi:hypothetical protein